MTTILLVLPQSDHSTCFSSMTATCLDTRCNRSVEKLRAGISLKIWSITTSSFRVPIASWYLSNNRIISGKQLQPIDHSVSTLAANTRVFQSPPADLARLHQSRLGFSTNVFTALTECPFIR